MYARSRAACALALKDGFASVAARSRSHTRRIGSGLVASTLLLAGLTAVTAAPAQASTLTFTNYTTGGALVGSNFLTAVYVDGSTIYAASGGGGLFISTNGGSSFTNRTAGPAPGNGLGSDNLRGVFAAGSAVYAATAAGLSISTDGGATFTNRTSGAPPGGNGLGSSVVNGAYAAGSTVYGSTEGGLSISTDGGETFTNRTSGAPPGGNGLGSNVVQGVYVDGSTVYAETQFGLSISTDGGETFTNRTTTNTGSPGLGSNDVREVYVSGSTVYAATIGGLSISTDGGANFVNRTTANGIGSNFVYGLYVVGSTVYAATADGLSISTNGGTSFTNYKTADGLGSNSVRGVYVVGSTVYAATTGGLSIASTIPGTPSITSATPGNGTASIAFTPPSSAGVSPITNYQYRLDSGAWVALSPASTTSPFTISGLTNGQTYSVTLRAVNSVGVGAVSGAVTVTPQAPAPGPGPAPAPTSTPEPTPEPTPTPTPTPTPSPSVMVDPLAPIDNGDNTNIPAGGLPAGGSLLLVNGEPTPVTVGPNRDQDPTTLVITAPVLTPPLRMTLEGRGDTSDPLGLIGKQTLVLQSQPVSRSLRIKDATPKKARVQPVAVATGQGFKANSPVKLFLLPGTEIGTLTTDASGNYSGRVPIPAGLAPGVYTLQSNGLAPDGSVRSLSIGVVVRQAKTTVAVRTARDVVYFDALSPVLTAEGKSELKALVKKTGKNVVSVRSVGFVQRSGSSVNDQSLSEHRARAVAAYLKSLGVKGAFTVRGDGVAKEPGAIARRVEVGITYRSK
jgi:outer membrane protein OmpA-like peptidoglycan-associated protein